MEQKKLDYKGKDVDKKTASHALPSPLLLSGTAIGSGEGKMVALMVGEDSCLGKILS